MVSDSAFANQNTHKAALPGGPPSGDPSLLALLVLVPAVEVAGVTTACEVGLTVGIVVDPATAS